MAILDLSNIKVAKTETKAEKTGAKEEKKAEKVVEEEIPAEMELQIDVSLNNVFSVQRKLQSAYTSFYHTRSSSR